MNQRDAYTMERVLGASPMPARTGAPENEARLEEFIRRIGRPEAAISPVVVTGFVRLIDLALILLTGYAAYFLYLFPREGLQFSYIAGIPLVSVLCTIAFQAANIYSVQMFRTLARQTLRIFAAWAGVFAASATLVFFLKLGADLSRAWFGMWFTLGLATLVMFRMALAFQVRDWTRSGRLIRRAVIVGGGEPAAELIRMLESDEDNDLEICGVFDDRGDDRSPSILAGHQKLGTVDDLVRFARRIRLDLLIVSLPVSAEARVLQMLRKLWVLPVDIRLSAHTNKLKLRPRSYSFIGTVPMLDLFDKPLADWDYLLKQTFDRVLGALILLLAAPVMIAVAIAVKLDSKGPVFFRQKRYGFNNEMIEVFKFRSMYTDMSDANASRLVTKDDPRVTPVGRFIRKTSLDELPQLFNVLRGELSIVGPRPHAVQAKAANRLYDDVVDGYFARHRVKPGITGWAQVNGWRGETDTQEKIQRRVEHDLFYIENWSVWFDFYIVIMTPISMLTKTEGAY
ncbi:MAG: undecaprenyl-phosphate glucose phosphotransferase [Flavobacteriaceae bacterium]